MQTTSALRIVLAAGIVMFLIAVVLVVVYLVVAARGRRSSAPVAAYPAVPTAPGAGGPHDAVPDAVQSAVVAAGGAARSLEERLAEVDDLARRGVIDEAERAAARARILGEV